jgi:DNA primase
MARIPQDELERLKREVSVRGLAEARGVKLEPHGDNLIGLCPFHDDKDPSLVISPKKNLWNCLGACGKGGSVVDWVMAAEGVSFRHAVEILRADNPGLSGDPAPPPKHSTVPKLPLPVNPKSTDAELLTQVAEYYHETLEQSPEALEYLDSRGLNSPGLAARFKLGFANRTLGYRLPQKNRKDGQEIRTRLQEIGVIRESGHEHLNGSLVIPICDAAGNVVQLYGRKITPNLRSGTPRHLYLPGPRRGLFNLEASAAIEGDHPLRGAH